MAEELLMRDQVDEKETWNLGLIYPTEELMWEDVRKLQAMAAEIEKNYKGKLTDAANIVSCLEQVEQVQIIAYHTGSYANLAVEVDYYNGHNMDRSARVNAILAQVNGQLSFVESEILMQQETVLQEAIVQAKGCKCYLQNLLVKKPHMLHPEAERVVAAMAHTIDAPYEMYNNIKLADMVFDPFEVDGKKYALGYSLFEDEYEYSTDTGVRRTAFQAFSDKIRQYQNATATAWNAYLQQQKIMADLRGYASLEEMNLSEQRVTKEMYDRQIDLITTKLAPHMRRYAKLLQHVHGLEQMTYADLKLPVDPSFTPALDMAQAEAYVSEGLSMLGEEYVGMVHEAFQNRWIDFAKNQGKCTGGFCESPYRKGSYILTTWNGQMADVITLAHELGHAGHFMRCNNAQSLYDCDVSMYFVEAPSTINELFMSHYMMKQNTEDKRFRRWVLGNIVGNTYYHNFVTHLLEAAYQREVNKIITAGGSVQAETLNEIFLKVLTDFWGEDVEMVPGAELTWMRQPHYYMGLYSYTYSAGLTIATQMCKRVEKEGQNAVEDWLKVLSAGSTLDPAGLAALGGVDITTDAALLDTIDTIGSYIDEMWKLTMELEA